MTRRKALLWYLLWSATWVAAAICGAIGEKYGYGAAAWAVLVGPFVGLGAYVQLMRGGEEDGAFDAGCDQRHVQGVHLRPTSGWDLENANDGLHVSKVPALCVSPDEQVIRGGGGRRRGVRH